MGGHVLLCGLGNKKPVAGKQREKRYMHVKAEEKPGNRILSGFLF